MAWTYMSCRVFARAPSCAENGSRNVRIAYTSRRSQKEFQKLWPVEYSDFNATGRRWQSCVAERSACMMAMPYKRQDVLKSPLVGEHNEPFERRNRQTHRSAAASPIDNTFCPALVCFIGLAQLRAAATIGVKHSPNVTRMGYVSSDGFIFLQKLQPHIIRIFVLRTQFFPHLCNMYSYLFCRKLQFIVACIMQQRSALLSRACL